MKSLLSRIKQKVLEPAPLRKFSVQALSREITSLEGLIKRATNANHEAFKAIDAEQSRKLQEAAQQEKGRLGVSFLSTEQFNAIRHEALKDGPHLLPEHDYVVRQELLDLLTLRLKLCQSELARKRLTRRAQRRS